MKYLLFILFLIAIIQPVIAEIRYEESVNPSENTIDNMYCVVGNHFLDKGEFSNALGAFTYALKQNPNNIIALNGEGLALSGLGRDEDAIQFYDKILLLEPNRVIALQNKALSLAILGRFEEALQTADKALSIDPKRVSVIVTKSSTLYQLGRYQEALQTSEQALLIDSNRTDVWNTKGNALSGLKQYQEAIQSYDKAIALAPPSSPDAEGAYRNKVLAQNLMVSSTQLPQPSPTITQLRTEPTIKSPLLLSTIIAALLFAGVCWKLKRKI